MLSHFINKLQLMRKFWVFIGISNITASWHIKIVNPHAISGDSRNMPTI